MIDHDPELFEAVIERLERQVAALEAELAKTYILLKSIGKRADAYETERNALEAECDRLREALNTIDLMCSCEYPEQTYVGKNVTVSALRQVAREALGDE